MLCYCFKIHGWFLGVTKRQHAIFPVQIAGDFSSVNSHPSCLLSLRCEISLYKFHQDRIRIDHISISWLHPLEASSGRMTDLLSPLPSGSWAPPSILSH